MLGAIAAALLLALLLQVDYLMRCSDSFTLALAIMGLPADSALAVRLRFLRASCLSARSPRATSHTPLLVLFFSVHLIFFQQNHHGLPFAGSSSTRYYAVWPTCYFFFIFLGVDCDRALSRRKQVRALLCIFAWVNGCGNERYFVLEKKL